MVSFILGHLFVKVFMFLIGFNWFDVFIQNLEYFCLLVNATFC